MKILKIIGLLIGSVIGLIFSFILFAFFTGVSIPLAISLIASFKDPADHATYRQYKEAVESTPDESKRVSCGNLEIEVIHTDQAIKGRAATIDVGADAPELRQVYTINGYKDGNPYFSTSGNDGVLLDSLNSLHRYTNGIEKYYVINKIVFEDLNSQVENRRQRKGSILDFTQSSQISSSDIESFARCYLHHGFQLNKILETPMMGFIKSNNTRFDKEIFVCTSEDRLIVHDSIIKLNGVDDNVIGKIELNGTLSSLPDNPKNAIPKSQRNAESWNTCKNDSGTTLQEYLFNQARKVIYL